jgi:hypothetical protein
MSLEDGQKLYELKHKLAYSFKGETREAQFLELSEPGGSHRRGFLKLKQMVRSLVIAMGSKLDDLEKMASNGRVAGGQVQGLHEKDHDEHESEAEELAEILGLAFGAADEVQLCNFVDIFGEIACHTKFKTICSVDGEVPMTATIWNDLHPDDAEGVALTYAGFFIMPSEFRSGSTSEKPSE